MFDFLDMVDNYEERKVDNTTINGVKVDTCSVTDSDQPYETGICSKHYNDDKWIIVELYDTKELAEEGHKKWVKKFKGKLPDVVEDVSTCTLATLLKVIEPEEKNIHIKQ